MRLSNARLFKYDTYGLDVCTQGGYRTVSVCYLERDTVYLPMWVDTSTLSKLERYQVAIL